MSLDVVMPQMGESIAEGTIVRWNKKVGDTVDRDDVIGLAGSTGRSTGTHLHYEVRQDGHAVDPVYFMNAGLKLATYIK